MNVSRKFKSKFFGILSLAILGGMLSSVSSVSASEEKAEAVPSLYKDRGYLQGGVIVFSGPDFVRGPVRAYYELYRDGTYLGSKLDEQTNWYLEQDATALITDQTHNTPGLYTMSWSGRVGGIT